MSKNILILYASVDGQTKKISNFLSEELRKKGVKVVQSEVINFNSAIDQYDAVILGSSIRYGVHHASMIEYIDTHRELLDRSKTAFFSVNLVARKPEKNEANTNPYVIKFFKDNPWRPDLVEVFAGKLDYKKYPFFDRIMIQFIMWMTKGPTDKNTKIEYTNWDRVDQFAHKVMDL